MKKILTIVIIFTILLSGCAGISENIINENKSNNTDNNIASDIINNDYYFLNKRVNMETGALTYICPDPLCMHDSDNCPLYGCKDIGTYYIFKNKVYFICRIDNTKKFAAGNIVSCSIRQYDILKNKTTILYDFDNDSMSYSMQHADNSLYYNCNIPIKTNAKGESAYKNLVIKVNMDKETCEIIYETDGEINNNTCLGIIDNIIYWRSEAGYYTTDLSGNDKKEIDDYKCKPLIKADGYIYKTDNDPTNKHFYGAVYRTVPYTGENIKIVDECDDYLVGVNYFYYEIKENGTTILYRMKNDGSEKVKIYDDGGTMLFYILVYGMSNDNYLIFPFVNKDDIKLFSTGSPDTYSFFILDNRTLEYKIVK